MTRLFFAASRDSSEVWDLAPAVPAPYSLAVNPLAGLGRALALLRADRGLTQEQLGGRLDGGVTNSSVSRLEAARANPRVDTLARHLEALGADLYDLADSLERVNGRTPQSRIPPPPRGPDETAAPDPAAPEYQDAIHAAAADLGAAVLKLSAALELAPRTKRPDHHKG